MRTWMLPLLVLSAAACTGSDTTPQSFDDALDRVVVQDAIAASGFTVHVGDDPPDITGVYEVAGEIVDSEGSGRTPGLPISGILCFEEQADGTVTEKEPGVVEGRVGWIAGTEGAFTIAAYLTFPSGCSQFSFTSGERLDEQGSLSATFMDVSDTEAHPDCNAGWELGEGIMAKLDRACE